ncbi:unnamed protein product [Durusdinium trenchii]|uniref:Uncharacterized protein n=2 Tax=Durusdinium trenchii TaxID=1381693 RepID=A0ABP0JTB2_9DINO
MSEEEPSSPQGDRAQRCPVHLAFPDLVRCDKCQEVHKDLPAEGKAPLPGLKNSFPVVAAQSDTRLDHLESQHPDGVLDFYQRLEEKHGKYLFERNEQQEALELERRKLQLQRERTKKAKHDAERAVLDAEWRVADAERSVEERRARREQDLQALEVQVRQADILYDESAREMKKRLAEAEGLKIAEEAHLAASLRLWNAARAKTDAARRRYEEAKAAAAQRLCAREKEIQEMAEEMDRQEAEAKEQAEEHLRFVKEQCDEHVKAMRVQSSKIKEAVAANLPMAIKRTVAAQELTQHRRLAAHERLSQERGVAGIHTTAMEEDCSAMVRCKEEREEITRRHFEEFCKGTVADMHQTAEGWHAQADRRSLCDKVSLEQTAWVLGHHFKSRWHYTPSVDSKVTNILQGCLHGRDPKSVLPHPSPRSLEPPGDLPQLRPRPLPMLANGLAGNQGT